MQNELVAGYEDGTILYWSLGDNAATAGVDGIVYELSFLDNGP